MTLKYRTDGPWGTGQAADLPAADIDSNFWQLLERVGALEATPPEAVGIEDFTVVGNQMTVLMTDGSTRGPFALPVAQLGFAGEWRPNTTYLVPNLFTENGSLYIVQFNHTSAAVFDPGANDGAGHDYYGLVLAAPIQPYDVALFYAPEIPGDASILLQHTACRTFTIPGAFGDSVAALRVACTANMTLPITREGIQVGTVEFQVGVGLEPGGGQIGTFTAVLPDPIVVVRQDELAVLAPAIVDVTAAGLTVTFACQTEAL